MSWQFRDQLNLEVSVPLQNFYLQTDFKKRFVYVVRVSWPFKAELRTTEKPKEAAVGSLVQGSRPQLLTAVGVGWGPDRRRQSPFLAIYGPLQNSGT